MFGGVVERARDNLMLWHQQLRNWFICTLINAEEKVEFMLNGLA